MKCPYLWSLGLRSQIPARNYQTRPMVLRTVMHSYSVGSLLGSDFENRRFSRCFRLVCVQPSIFDRSAPLRLFRHGVAYMPHAPLGKILKFPRQPSSLKREWLLETDELSRERLMPGLHLQWPLVLLLMLVKTAWFHDKLRRRTRLSHHRCRWCAGLHLGRFCLLSPVCASPRVR